MTRFSAFVLFRAGLSLGMMMLCAACTPVSDYAKNTGMSVEVEADELVRAEIGDVEVVVESRTPSASSWTLETSQRFTPSADGLDWPLTFRVGRYNPEATYQVTATSRDDAGGIAIQVRAIGAANLPTPRELHLRFDGECLKRTTLCGRMLTCSIGDCVDARAPLRERMGPVAVPRTQTEAPRVEMESVCDQDGARSCAVSSERLPLICKSGAWQPEAECSENMRCDDGRCVALGAQCAALGAGARFCGSGGLIYKCEDANTAMAAPCGDNEHCVAMNGDVRCGCLPGFVKEDQVCTEPVDCRDNGGCDALTQCGVDSGKRVCTMCPPGYVGTGETGCAAQVTDLMVSPGTLQPVFDPNVTKYSVEVPLWTPRVQATVNFDVPADLMINDQAAMKGTPWLSPVLGPGQTQIDVSLRTPSSVRTDYQLTLERAAAKQTTIKAEVSRGGEQFGGWVAAHGDTIVVGVPYEMGSSAEGPDSGPANLTNAGAAYVFVRNADGSWRQQGYLKANPIKAQDYFGSAVAIWKDRIAVGAPGDLFSTFTTGAANGVVHFYARSGETWTHEGTINSGNTVANGDWFGFRVELRETSVMVGAPLDDNGGTRSGAAYVYAWDGAQWQQQQRLKASTPVAEGRYGAAIAFDDNIAVVGAFAEDHDGRTRAGAAYAYIHGPDGWTFAQRLIPPTPRPYTQYGATIAIEGTTVVVTAPHNPLEVSSSHSGEAHVYEVAGTNFTLVQTLEAMSPRTGDQFASGISLRNGVLLLGSPWEATATAPHGAVYVFARGSAGFTRSNILAPPTIDEEDYFGYVIALTDNFAVIGTPADDSSSQGVNADTSNNSRDDSGAVYIFE